MKRLDPSNRDAFALGPNTLHIALADVMSTLSQGCGWSTAHFERSLNSEYSLVNCFNHMQCNPI